MAAEAIDQDAGVHAVDAPAGTVEAAGAPAADWPYPTNVVVLVNPDPVARRRLIRIVAVALFLAFVGWLSTSCSPVGERLAKQQRAIDAEHLQPRMRVLADAGSREAAIWLAQWFPASERARLAPLVDAGDAHALYVLALLTRQDGKSSDADAAMRRSAAAGYPEAVAFESGLHLPGAKP